MSKEKKVNKSELENIIRGMVKESLETLNTKTKKINESKSSKISVKQLREMVRESIQEVLAEEAEAKKADSKKTK